MVQNDRSLFLGSHIYEDPSFRYDAIGRNRDRAPIDMEHYLVPYEFVRKNMQDELDKSQSGQVPPTYFLMLFALNCP